MRVLLMVSMFSFCLQSVAQNTYQKSSPTTIHTAVLDGTSIFFFIEDVETKTTATSGTIDRKFWIRYFGVPKTHADFGRISTQLRENATQACLNLAAKEYEKQGRKVSFNSMALPAKILQQSPDLFSLEFACRVRLGDAKSIAF